MKGKLSVLACALSATLLLSSLAGCGGGGETPSTSVLPTDSSSSTVSQAGDSDFTPSGKVDADINATLTIAAWDATAIALYDSLDLEGRFQKYYPNVNIEIEQSKNDTEYWQSMQIRASANQLPDIMFNKPFTLSNYKDYLIDLTEPLAAEIADNTVAKGYALDGKVMAIPEKSVADYVYYWADMFEEAKVEVPTTWSEFVDVCKKLQDHFGAKDADYSAVAIGAKDEWPTYSYTEFMPALVGGNGQNWNTMATQDAPFAEGTDINKAFHKVYDLFSSGVCGKDPLGVGQDQAMGLFCAKKSSIIAAGSWGVLNVRDGAADVEGLSSFYMPVRDNADDTFYIIAQGDCMMGATTHSKNPDLAVDFIRFYFSKAWYPDYVDSIGDDSVMKSFPKEKDPALKEADEKQPNAELVLYDGGGENFQKIQSEVKFDYKKLGAQMFVPGFDLDATLAQLDKDWAAARKSLKIS